MSGIFFIVLVFLIAQNVRLYRKRTDIYSQTEVLKKRLENLNQEKENLQGEISQSQFPEYWERVVRETLNLKKEGEEVVAFPVVGEEQKQLKIEEKKDLLKKVLEKLNKPR